MDVVEDSAKREALAQRMSKLLGLPITNIQLLMPLISKDDLERLESLPDDQFLSQATKIINAAQKRQFSDQDDEDSGGESAPAEPPAQPDAAPADPPSEPMTLKRKTVGRKGQKPAAEDEADDDDDVGPAVGESQTGVKVVESNAAEMPAAFKRPVKKEGLFSDKKVVFALVAGGVGALVLIVLAIIFVLQVFMTPNISDPGDAEVPLVDKPIEVKPAVVTYSHDAAMELADTFYLEVETAEISGPVTAEFWVMPLAGVGKQEVLITGEGGGEETFRLIFRRLDAGGYEAEFAVPTARREAAIFTFDSPLEGKWVHLAGVYDPLNSGAIYLFAGGQLVAEAPSADVSDMVTSSYRLISTVSNDSEGFLVDEVRLTNAPRYVGEFKPERFFEVLSDTRSLLHLEEWEDGKVMDAAADNRKIDVPESVSFVALAAFPDAPIFKVELAPVPFPPQILDRLLEVSGQEYVDSLLAEWKTKSRAQRISYLETIGVPPEVIEELASSRKSAPEAVPE